MEERYQNSLKNGKDEMKMIREEELNQKYITVNMPEIKFHSLDEITEPTNEESEKNSIKFKAYKWEYFPENKLARVFVHIEKE